MKVLLQRVREARVEVAGETVGEVDAGLVVFLGLDRGDDRDTAERMIDRLLAYRVFADERGRMNRSISDTGGGLLLVSQFTLSADTARGLRPSFSAAMAPGDARELYDYTLERLQRRHSPVAAGIFGADMQVALVNDGPVTFLLESQAG